MQADGGYTHPPGSIKVALGQGFVIIGIRIREGPLSHDAGNEPAEQGEKNTETEAGARLTRVPSSSPQLPLRPTVSAVPGDLQPSEARSMRPGTFARRPVRSGTHRH